MFCFISIMVAELKDDKTFVTELMQTKASQREKYGVFSIYEIASERVRGIEEVKDFAEREGEKMEEVD